MHFMQALKFVKSKRSVACPNLGFERQLKGYDSYINYVVPKEKLHKNIQNNIQRSKSPD